MPKVNLMEKVTGREDAKRIARDIQKEIKMSEYNQADIAEVIGVTPAAFSKKISRGFFSLSELVLISRKLKREFLIGGQ